LIEELQTKGSEALGPCNDENPFEKLNNKGEYNEIEYRH